MTPLAPLIAAGIAIALVAPQTATDGAPEDVTVTARRPTGAPIPHAPAQWQRICVDPMRRTGRFAPPIDDPDWQPLDPADRRRFGIADDAVPAFGLVDGVRGHTLLVKVERFALPGRLNEDRCTLVIVGGRDHPRLAGAVSGLLGAPGTQRHVGEPDGAPAIAGWRQWLWSAMPARGSRRWRIAEAPRAARGAGTWIVVADRELFYRISDYVLADLKIRDGGDRALSMLTLAYTTRRD